jgi:chromosome segregation ATPase
MIDPYKINFVAAPLAPAKAEKEVNLVPMSAEEVEMLRSFLQREIDVIRADMKDARKENARAHNEVTAQISAVREDIADLSERVHEVETHEETADHADLARKEVKDSLRRSFLAANAVLGTVIVVVIYLIDKL